MVKLLIKRYIPIVEFLAYTNNKIFAVARKEVRIAYMDAKSFGFDVPVEIKPEMVRVIKPSALIHGVLLSSY